MWCTATLAASPFLHWAATLLIESGFLLAAVNCFSVRNIYGGYFKKPPLNVVNSGCFSAHGVGLTVVGVRVKGEVVRKGRFIVRKGPSSALYQTNLI